MVLSVNHGDTKSLDLFDSDKSIGALPGCDYVLTRMVIQII
jgi:hypothetical protein